MEMQHRDYVERRIIVEYGRRYVYLTLADATGKILPGREEVFTQPFVLERKDVHEKADDCWQAVYQWLSDVVVFPLPEGRDRQADSEEEDTTP